MKRVKFENLEVGFCNLNTRVSLKAFPKINGKSLSVLFEKGTPQAVYVDEVFKALKSAVESAYEAKNGIAPQSVVSPLKESKKSKNHLTLTFPYKDSKAFMVKEEEIEENGKIVKQTGRMKLFKEASAIQGTDTVQKQAVTDLLETGYKLNAIYTLEDKIDIYQVVDGVKQTEIVKKDGTTVPLWVSTGDIVNIDTDIICSPSRKEGEESKLFLRCKIISIEIVQKSNNNFGGNSDFGIDPEKVIDLSNIEIPTMQGKAIKPKQEEVKQQATSAPSNATSSQISQSDIDNMLASNEGWE